MSGSAKPVSPVSVVGTLSSQREVIGAALGRIPSGCAILTVHHAGQSTGVLVSWFQQASFEPPSVSVGLRKGRPAGELVEQSGRFLLNIVGANPTPMFRHFGRGFSLSEDAFAGLDTAPTDYGTLIRSCLAHLGCSLSQKIAVGDHDLYIAQIDCATSPPTGQMPYVHTRNSGFSY
jgi:flavin reductase (DIM6/NTAB) family NADH-FMN oxidoreductase RutF